MNVLSPEKFFQEITKHEEAELKEQFPEVVRTEKDLGPYSQRIVLENYFEVEGDKVFLTQSELERKWPELAQVTEETFCGDLLNGFGTSGQYHWNLIKAKCEMGEEGKLIYYFQVQVQTQVDDPQVTIYGIDTLSVVNQVRSYLSKNGKRIDILPQNNTGETIPVMMDRNREEGVNDKIPHNQEEMVEALCEQLDMMISQYHYDQYLFDFRLASKPEIYSHVNSDLCEFVFVCYFEPVQ